MVRRREVSSSVVRSVGYDQTNQTLEVEFHNDRLYRYFMVPHSTYLELMRAASLGRYFNEHIRDRYPVRQVGQG